MTTRMRFLLACVAGLLALVAVGSMPASGSDSPLVVQEDVGDLPEEFDARKQWPHCPSIGTIYDQGSCHSSWAFAVAGTIMDRYCINSSMHLNISAQDLMTCCEKCQRAKGQPCQGSISTEEAWKLWNSTGIVTGGLYYKSGSGCRPYNITPCDHYEQGPLPDCGIRYRGPIQACVQKCEKGYPKSYADDRHFGIWYKVSPFPDQIKAEIMKYGPVQSEVVIDKAFTQYRSGVYTPSMEYYQLIFVKIIGWGYDKAAGDYWICALSWNTDWGDKGYFKIRIGQVGTVINSGVYAGTPVR